MILKLNYEGYWKGRKILFFFVELLKASKFSGIVAPSFLFVLLLWTNFYLSNIYVYISGRKKSFLFFLFLTLYEL